MTRTDEADVQSRLVDGSWPGRAERTSRERTSIGSGRWGVSKSLSLK
jgi:hypothetical protein